MQKITKKKHWSFFFINKKGAKHYAPMKHFLANQKQKLFLVNQTEPKESNNSIST